MLVYTSNNVADYLAMVMNMNTKQIGAIAVVLVIIIAGVSVYLAFGGGSSNNYPNYGLSDNTMAVSQYSETQTTMTTSIRGMWRLLNP